APVSQTTGTVYYVAKTGSNSNSCAQARSEATPKLTITAGLACMASGDTLMINDGIYPEFIDYWQLTSGISESQRTVIRAVNPLGAILRPTGGDAATGSVIWVYGKSYITFDGLDVDAVNARTMAIYLNNYSSHIKIQNSVLRNAHDDQACLAI